MLFKQKASLVSLLISFIFISGCNSLFFYPMQKEVLTPQKIGMAYSDIYLTTPDGIKIHGWHLPSSKPRKGSLIFFHGNAQNISTHIASVYWLPNHGYDVFLFDYRGYGRSEGTPDVKGVILDANTAINHVINDLGQKKIIVFGQSLGGAISVNAVAEITQKKAIKAVIIDSSFSGFREIAREKLSDVWLTWPFQYPLSLAFTNTYSAKTAAAQITPVPILIIHGNADNTIPLHHGKDIFNSANSPKIFWEIEGGKHIDSMTQQHLRDKFLNFLDAAVNNRIEKDTARGEILQKK